MARNVAHREITRLHIVLQAEALNHTHPAYDYFLRREAMVLDEFTRMFEPLFEDSDTLARQMLALMDGLAQQWLRVDGAFDLIDIWDRTVSTILRKVSHKAKKESLV